MNIPFPIRDVYLHNVAPDSREQLQNSLVSEILGVLRSIPIFKPLPDPALEQLARDSSLLRYAGGEVLVRQRDIGDSLYIIQSGCVEVTVCAGEGHKPMKVAELGPNSFFGEMSLLTGDPRSATVTAREETIVVVVKKRGMERVFSMSPALAEPLSELLQARLNALKEASRESEKTVEEREGQKREGSDDILTRIRSFFGL